MLDYGNIRAVLVRWLECRERELSSYGYRDRGSGVGKVSYSTFRVFSLFEIWKSIIFKAFNVDALHRGLIWSRLSDRP